MPEQCPRRLSAKLRAASRIAATPDFMSDDAAAIELVAVGFTGERVPAPLARAERHHVEVAGQTQGRLLIGTAKPRDYARAAFLIVEILNIKTPFFQQRARHLGAIALATGRVDGIEAQQIARKRNSILAGHGWMIAFQQRRK